MHIYVIVTKIHHVGNIWRVISVLKQRAVLLGADWSWLVVADWDLQVKRYDCIDLRMRLDTCS